MSSPVPVARHGSSSRRSSVYGAIVSYGRSQTFLSGSHLESAMATRYPDVDQAYSSDEEDSDEEHSRFLRTTQYHPGSIPSSSSYPHDPARIPLLASQDTQERILGAPVAGAPLGRRVSHADFLTIPATQPLRTIEESPPPPAIQRRHSYGTLANASAMTEEGRPRLVNRTSNNLDKISIPRGKSTYGQTLFNSIAILLGIGMLSEPLAFAQAGWVGGTMLLIFYGAVSCYTAKILAKIIHSDRRLRTYADIGRKAFGPNSNAITSFLFCLELFAVCVVLITLAADSLHSVVPAFSANAYKLFGIIFIVPSVFIPLRLLSYASVLGIFSTVMIIFAVMFDGYSKREAPGSLWEPAPTQWLISDSTKIGTAFGLFMAGFAGHAVIPSLAKDMAEPERFDEMIDYAFFIATFIYGLIGAAGYLMFGDTVSDEISIDLLKTPGYNPVVNQIAVWMLVISPLTKLSLTMRPLNISLEVLLGLEDPIAVDLDHGTPAPKPTPIEQRPLMHDHTDTDMTITPANAHTTKISDSRHIIISRPTSVAYPHPPPIPAVRREFLITVERSFVAVFAVLVSVFIPEFSSMMAFLGSFSAFLLCILGPIAAKVALAGRCSWMDAFLLTTIFTMMVWGTGVAFLAQEQ